MSEKSQLFSRIALDWSDPEQLLKVIENRKRRARPELEANFVEPSDPIHKQLAAIWIEVLGIERAAIHHNFYKLGGDSLLATQVVSRIRELFPVELPLRSSFELPTVAGLAESIERHLEASGEETTGKIVRQAKRDLYRAKLIGQDQLSVPENVKKLL